VARKEVFEPPQELTLEDMVLALLDNARSSLGRNDRDWTGVDRLEDYLRGLLPKHRHLVPPEAIKFLNGLKRPRGRVVSHKDDWSRYRRDPNRMAAHYAADIAADLREKHGGTVIKDGSKRQAASGRWLSGSTVNDRAARQAVAMINKWEIFVRQGRRASVVAVKKLLEKDRTARPYLPQDDDPNGWW